MRFEGNSKGINRSDYEQFSRFLGMSSQRCQRDNTQGVCAGKNDENQTQGRPLAMVYGVIQEFVEVYDPMVALETGTVFQELNKPFYNSGCKSKGGEGCL